jgi:ribosomal protein L11 methylase PrmA
VLPASPTVVANLTAPLLRAVADRLDSPPERLVCSGLLSSEVSAVAGALAAAGLESTERRVRGDWAALVCRRRNSGARAK